MLYLHVVPPTAMHSHTVIFVHGRGSVASEFADELFESQASDERFLTEIFPTFKWVFPSSAIRTSARFGDELSQWFDIWSVEEPEERKDIQKTGLSESISSILKIIQHEASFVGMDKIILAGISQGCATAIHALLQGEVRIGAFIGLCSWLPFYAEMEEIAKSSTTSAEKQERLRNLFPLQHPLEEGSNSALNTPILLTHSKNDNLVLIGNGEKLCKGLTELGMSVEWHAYEDGGHWVNEPQGIDDMVAFLSRACELEP